MTNDPRSDLHRLMLLSIKPEHVHNILCGRKTVELRRVRPQIEVGQPVAVYATAPRAAVVATCRVTAIDIATPKVVKRRHLSEAAISSKDFDSYYLGSNQAVALIIDVVTPLEPVVTLDELRARRRTYNPPQTWHFFDRAALLDLLGDHRSRPALTSMLAG